MTPEPITARQLAEKLLEHPDSVVQVALPAEMLVLGGIHLANEDGSLTPPLDKGVHLLVVSLGDRL